MRPKEYLKELERARIASLEMLRAQFPRFESEHDDFAQAAIVHVLETKPPLEALSGLATARARGLALTRANRAAREPVGNGDPEQAGQTFVSGKRALRPVRFNRETLDSIGRFFDRESHQIAGYLASSLLFKPDFISAHFGLLGRLIESTLEATPPADFVQRLMAFTDKTARLSPSGLKEWDESAATERVEIVGGTDAGKKPGRRRQKRGLLRGETEFRLKRHDVGRLIAAEALRLCGFRSREIHALGRKAARKESAFRKLWARKLEDAHDAEPDATDERFLELALLAVPGGASPERASDAPTRHPAFRRAGRRAK
jgi:hypothetical protein